ncbi:hypothetical protein Vau01_040630 [Virgisporangium aurantiacum]|uniref:non-specific serine/threonine protein kinase n=2 Tax=Virgisporangium aurantiacum TaxID=175570 RepID=A0A8J4E210_9ACTN|nr:hypothetical protein Vau01_040630 [Virgisporangium aurantiacum]
MSEIWRADDGLLGRAVAIKLPKPQVSQILYQAWIEARTTAKLSDPHIAAVHDYGEALRPDGSTAPFVVMELLDGESLAARLTSGPLPWRTAARIGAEVASGLATAHARRVVHRDIKPGNIMLTPTGTKILDFGISAITGTPDDDETGVTFGTPAYVAPERLDGTPAEPATDVYALGAVLFEMVDGEPPYPVDTWEEYASARTTPPKPLPADLPPEFRDLVDRCLSDDPRRRPAATDVRDRLTALGPPAVPPAVPLPGAETRPTGTPESFPSPASVTPSTIISPDGPGAGAVARTADRTADRTVVPAARRMPAPVRVAIVVLLLVAGGAVIGLRSWSTDRGDTPKAAPNSSEPPPATTPTAAPTSPAAPPPSGPPSSSAAEPAGGVTVSLDEAVADVIDAVHAGRATGDIRDDVAVDLINLLRQLSSAPAKDVSRRVAELQQKIRDRIEEGSLARAAATDLQNRLDRIARV